jgi:3-hydroxyisobutyrate dehydrogenase
MIGNGYQDVDFGALLEMEAKAAGLELKSENKKVDDGLGGKS